MTEKHFQLAYKIAEKAHEGQFRRDGVTPYFEHIKKALDMGKDLSWAEKVMIAIHDVIEDKRDTKEGLIEKGLDETLVSLVEKYLTHDPKESYDDYILKIARYRGRMFNTDLRKVKLADILANLTDSPSEKQKIKYCKAILTLMS
jgi:(p)ppGpp synthase/HD superfamily hydrolase